MRALLRNLWRTVTGRRLKESREARSIQNRAIKEAIVQGETRRIQELEREATQATDPKMSAYLKSEARRHERRLSETEEVARSLGIG